MMNCKIVVFHCPQHMHILTGCPKDLVRFESIEPTTLFAWKKIIDLENRYAPKNPSGYPASVYHYCTLEQWEEYWSSGDQLSLF